MNIKNSIFHAIAFFLIVNAQLVYTKEHQDDNNNSQSAITTNHDDISQNNTQYDEEMWKFTEETFQSVTDQTQQIEFCLQTIEQIINAGKLKFDNQKISKAQLLEEIKCIKQNIQNICEYFTKKFPKYESMIFVTCYNTAFIEYLLPIFQNDITEINIEKFDTYLEQNIERIATKLQDPTQLPEIIASNEANLKLLMNAGDFVGLSNFNKFYHYLDTKPLPWYGKSTIATAKDIALWGTAALITYGFAVYFAPRELTIRWTQKEYIAPEKPTPAINDPALVEDYKTWRLDPKNIEKIGDVEYQKTAMPDKFKLLVPLDTKAKNNDDEVSTWIDNGKTYTGRTVSLPLKSLFGDYSETKRYLIQQDNAEAKKSQKDFGLYSHIHVGAHAVSDPFVALIVGSSGALAWLVKKPIQEMYENAKKSFNYNFNYYIKGDITPPKNAKEITKTYFNEMIGGEHLEKLARELTDYLKNPTRYERAGISPSTGYLLVGPSQTGKSFFAKALKTMVDDEFDGTNEKVKFAIITADDLKYFGGFTEIFYWARKNAPIILFMDEIDMFGTRRDRDAKNTQELLTAMNGMDTDPSKKVIVIAATNKPEELDFALKQKGRLGTVITFDVPTYECRKSYLEKQLIKKNIMLNPEIIDTIAQETHSQTYNMIDDIIRQALQLATFQTRPVEEADFEKILDREIRKIKPNTTMSAQEQELVAIYQAGQAVARHLLATDQQIVKITIDTVDKPMKSKEGFGIVNEQKGETHENHELLPQTRIKPTRLGFVFTMSKTNNHELISDDDQERELMALLAGQAALELIKGKTFNGFGKEDRAKVIEALEKKISQGTPITDKIRQQAIAAKDILYQQAKHALQNHTEFIKIVMNELIKNHTITTKQWLQLTANYKI
jgi:AAA+ superfamily predicted ATPase